MRAKLYDLECQKAHDAEADARRSQIGTGDRSEKIRTYNFPQGRVTDHRIGLTLYKLDKILDGDIQEILDACIAADQAAKLAKMNDNYDEILNHDNIDKIRIVDMSQGKANDDGYRGVHLYFQLDHSHYPIEIQMNTYYDRQINNWLHKYLYKKNYPGDVGLKLRKLYENGKILNENMFREVLQNVLSDCKRI